MLVQLGYQSAAAALPPQPKRRTVRRQISAEICRQTGRPEFPLYHSINGTSSGGGDLQELQHDFRNVFVDPSMIRQDIENSYGITAGNSPLIRKKRIDAADATATLGLFDASQTDLVSEQEELDANDIEARAAAASPGGAAKLAAAANGALLRSQAYNQRLLARLMRLQALSIARENSIEKEQEQSRQDQVAAVTNMIGSMELSYGIGDRVR